MKIPRSILNHPAVAECNDGATEGSDYKYDVWLKDGWKFTSGRMAGCQGGFFNSVEEFKGAKPEEARP